MINKKTHRYIKVYNADSMTLFTKRIFNVRYIGILLGAFKGYNYVCYAVTRGDSYLMKLKWVVFKKYKSESCPSKRYIW